MPIPDNLRTALADRYRIERELGAGGMATVYLAHDVKHDRPVAIKVLKPELSAILGAERFLHEIKTTANLQHPHILSLFDSGEAGGQVFYVMPYVEGESLRDRLTREKQLPVDEAVRIAREVADALDYAHQHGVVHRDIKPENILLHGGHALVADFGIALAASRSDGSTRMTETGMSLGTPAYMSPEQAMGEREVTPRSDIYALGCVLYEMLTAEPPFVGATAQAIIARVLTEEPRSLTLQRRSIPPHVEAVVMHALEKLPADRFASAAEFGAALGNASFTDAAGHGLSRAVVPPRRAAVLWRTGGAAGLLLLGAAAGAWWRGRIGTHAHPWRVRITLPDSAPVGDMLSLSADGSALVYDGGGRLWLRTADAAGPVPIPGTEGGEDAALSPDGKRVAFLRNGSLIVQALDGGSPRVAASTPIGSSVIWSDDEHVVYSDLSGLMRVPIAGGDPQRLTTTDTAAHDVFHVEAAGLPGRGVIFTIAATNFDSSVIAAVGPDGGRITQLMPGIRAVFGPPGHLIVTRLDGSIVAVPFDVGNFRITGPPVTIASGLRTGSFTSTGRATASAGGRLIYVAAGWGGSEDPSDLVWVGAGRVTPVDESWRGAFMSVALSPDGRRAALGEYADRGFDLLIRDLASGSVARVAINGTVLVDPVFSPDGRELYFAGAGASQGLHRVDASGAARPELIDPTTTGAGHTAMGSSGDVLFVGTTGVPRIYRHSLSGRSPDSALTPPGVPVVRPQVSPDGRWLAYLAAPAGSGEVHVRSMDPGRTEDWRVSPSVDRGSSLRWSRSGTELYYVAGGNMMAAPVRTSPSFQGGTPRVLFAITGLQPIFDVRSDGQFLMLRWRPKLRPPTELVMLERWTDLLPR